MSRSARALAVGTVAAAAVAFLLIGGALRTGPQSASYLRDVNRSFADQVAVLTARSNALGRQLGTLLPAMAASSRPALEASLDTLVQQAESIARQAAVLESPAPSGGAGADVATAFAQRATAIIDLRRTLDRLLVLSPLPTVTSADPPATVAPTPPALSAAAATAALERVGGTIASSNRSYAAGRRSLRASPGRASLPPSSWRTATAAWTPTGAASLVAALGASPTLAAVHDVVLATGALALIPAPVPPANGASAPANAVEVPPTSKLAVSAVVANRGNVPARHVTVEVQVAPQTGKAPTRRSRTVSIGPGGSTTVTLPPAPVAPAHSYTVTVTVAPPVPDATTGAATSDTLSVTVAPPSPPAVAQVTPAKGPERGGNTVVILGSNFRQATAVKFGTTDASFTIVSGTEIKAVVPPGTGTVTVTVENAGGPSGYSAGNQYTYEHPRSGSGAGTTSTTSTTATTATTTPSSATTAGG
jgi:hypothetical protein